MNQRITIRKEVVDLWYRFAELAGISRDEIREWLRGFMLAPIDDPEEATKEGRESLLTDLARTLIAERKPDVVNP